MELTNLKSLLKKAIVSLYDLNGIVNNLKRIVNDVKYVLSHLKTLLRQAQ